MHDAGLDSPAPLLTLAIEVSNPSAAREGSGPGVALGFLRAGRAETLAVEFLRSARRHDDDLMPAIDRLWRSTERSRRDLARVAVSIGPGGYTGLRVAVVTAKLLAHAAGAACIGVPTALVVSRRVPADLPRPFAVALASKGRTSIVTRFDETDRPLGSPAEMDAEQCVASGARALVADAHLPEPFRVAMARAGLPIVAPVFDPAACLEAGATIAPVSPAALAPLYGREPEAVRKWRELHGRGG